MTFTLQQSAKDGLLPKEMAGEIFQRVTETSAIAKIAGRTDMSIQGSRFLIDTGKVEADVVKEGAAKPVSDFSLSYVETTPLKAAVIVDWTKEFRLANPAGVMDRIQEKLVEAINEQIDAAVLYGKSVKSQASIPNVTFLNQTKNRVVLGTAKKPEGGLTADIFAGYDAVLNGGNDFTGFVADPRLRSQLFSATDVNGRPVYQTTPDLRDSMGSLLGLPVSYAKSVSGRYGRAGADTGVRAFGGDFQNNLKFGFIEDISIRMSDQATVDNVSLWQTNKEAALAEAIFGFVIKDVNAFAAYTATADKPANPAG